MEASMSRATQLLLRTAMCAALAATTLPFGYGQTTEPTNDAPNPYRTIEDYFKFPDGRTWGSTSAVAVDRTGNPSGWRSAAAKIAVSTIPPPVRCPIFQPF